MGAAQSSAHQLSTTPSESEMKLLHITALPSVLAPKRHTAESHEPASNTISLQSEEVISLRIIFQVF